MIKDPFLRSLLEAPGDDNNPTGIDDPFATPLDNPNPGPDPATGGQGTGDNPTANMDDPFADAAGGDPNDPNAGMDLTNNPDGLQSPDATGSPDLGSFSGNDEKNLQVKIIQASKLERQLLKSKIYNKFRDLHNKIDVFRSNVENNETIIEPKTREQIFDALQQLDFDIGVYIEYKFIGNNYEENLKNYLVFARKISEIIDFAVSGTQQGNKHDKK